MPYKRGQEWLRSIGRPSVLGEGLLERARAISLALLGVTAAVGLAIIALVMNQSWPLVAGSSIPVISPQHQVIGKATVAAGMRSTEAEAGQARFVDHGPPLGHAAGTGHEPQGPGLAGSPASTDSTELVVAPSSPAKPNGNRPHSSPKPEPTPVVQQPQQASQASPGPSATEPAAVPVSQPPAETTPPGATTSEGPVSESDSDVPSWSHGGGHAYGHDDDGGDDDDWDDGGDSHEWGDHGHGGWHGHHYGD